MKTILFTLCLITTTIAHATTDAEAMAFLEKHAPDIHSRVVALQGTDPVDYRNALDDASKAADDLAKIEAANDPAAAAAYVKMYRIDFAAITVSDELLRTTGEAEKQRLSKKLRQLIADSFDQWIIVERARIARLEKELGAVKAEFEENISNREKAIDNDTQKLIEESRAYQEQKKQKAKP